MTKPKIEDYRAIDEFDLTESVFSVEEADGKKKMAGKIAIIKTGMSKNRRNYRESALKESVDKGIWNGVRMFANHSKTVPLQRPISEMVAAIESTEWNPTTKAIDADVRFFNKDFFEFAQEAKDYMGDSINAMVQGTRVRDGRGQVTEDIHRIVQPHSVDFVIYPSAGGMIHSFEGEGEMIDWTAITAKDIKENAAEVYAAIQKETPPPPDPPKDPEPPEGGLTQEQVNAQIAAALEARDKEQTETKKKIDAVNAKVVEAFKTAGLPEPVAKRVMSAFEGQTEFDEAAVKESIEEAKEELKVLGVGPRIVDQGPSGAAGEPGAKKAFSVQESVKDAFGMNKKKASDKKEDNS